jgi:hypothetical protein
MLTSCAKGLALSHSANDSLRLPSGTSLGEAKVKILEIGPLHKNLERSPLFKFVLTELFRNLTLTSSGR